MLVVLDHDCETLEEVLEQLATRVAPDLSKTPRTVLFNVQLPEYRPPPTVQLPKSIKLHGEPTAQPYGVLEEQVRKPNMLLT